jgi:hypothetical protein
MFEGAVVIRPIDTATTCQPTTRHIASLGIPRDANTRVSPQRRSRCHLGSSTCNQGNGIAVGNYSQLMFNFSEEAQTAIETNPMRQSASLLAHGDPSPSSTATEVDEILNCVHLDAFP